MRANRMGNACKRKPPCQNLRKGKRAERRIKSRAKFRANDWRVNPTAPTPYEGWAEVADNGLARALNVTPVRINDIVRERRGITADTALRLARFFGTDAQSWLNLQSHYDVQCAEDELGAAIGRILPLPEVRRHLRIMT